MRTSRVGWGKRYLGGLSFKSGKNGLDRFVLLYLMSFLLIYIRAVRAGIADPYSFYEIFLWTAGKPENLVFLQLLLGLVLVPRVLVAGPGDMVFLVRRKSRKDVWANNMVSVLFVTAVAVAGLLGMSFFVTLFESETRMNTNVTEFLTVSFAGVFTAPGQTVDGVSLALLGNVTAFFLCTALCFYQFLLSAGTRQRAFVMLALLIGLDCAVCYAGGGVPVGVTFLGNVLPVCREGVCRTGFHGIYWVCVCLFLCVSCYLTANNTDMIRTVKKTLPAGERVQE